MDVLAEKIQLLPQRPGVYLFRGERGALLYVGKALSLHSRVRQYFQPSHNRGEHRTRALVEQIRDLEAVVAPSEAGALSLESALIRRLRPPFNVSEGQARSSAYLAIRAGEAFPRIELTTDPAPHSVTIGPVPRDRDVMERAERLMRRLFKLRGCEIEISGRGDRDRPCLDYHLGRCTAPCVRWGATRQAYDEQVEHARALLAGDETWLAWARREMHEAAASLSFEHAAALRDEIAALESVLRAGRRALPISEIGIAAGSAGPVAAAQALMLRGGRLVDHRRVVVRGLPRDAVRRLLAGLDLRSRLLASRSTLHVAAPASLPLAEPEDPEAGGLIEAAEANVELILAHHRLGDRIADGRARIPAPAR